jgi:riboflavin biosynthesis pyrimidine reductase
MRNFDVLFDDAEPSPLPDAAFDIYGPLGFPAAPQDRPWIYTNFVQSLDGIVSYKGKHASGADLSESPEDRWLMDLLRAYADAVLVGTNTLMDETQPGPRPRGPVFRIVEPGLRTLRQKLGRRREMNIFVTSARKLTPCDYRVFDGEHVDPVILTTASGAARLAKEKSPHVRVLVCGDGDFVPLEEAMRRLRRELNIHYLLCEGGPTLYGGLSRAGVVDEKFLTVAPVEVGQFVPPEQEPSETERENPPRMRPTVFDQAPGFPKEKAPHWQWLSCRRVGHHQFNRYRRVR